MMMISSVERIGLFFVLRFKFMFLVLVVYCNLLFVFFSKPLKCKTRRRSIEEYTDDSDDDVKKS